LADYWVGDVEIAGIHELVGNALVMKGEEKRTMDLRMEPLANVEETAEPAAVGADIAEGGERDV
jgi:hypothetical protein